MAAASQSFDAERAVFRERAVLGCLLEAPGLWSKAGELTAADFQLDDHRKIFRAIADLNEHSCLADIVSVSDKLGESVPAHAISGLIDGAVPENFGAYVRRLRESTRDKRFWEMHASLGQAKTAEDRLAWLDLMRSLIADNDDAQNCSFHTYEEIMNTPPVKFAIDGFLQEGGITFIGGLAGHGKTFVMLSMVRSLLAAEPLFGYEPFKVKEPAKRVVYLIPECGLAPFVHRLRLFNLLDYVRDGRLLFRTLNHKIQITELDDPRILKAVEGADVFLDTAARFMSGSEDIESARRFADTLFRLLQAGARSITGAHHSPKGFESQDYMVLEKMLRGSGDIGAMLCTAWGIRPIDPSRNRIYVANVKPRDFPPCQPFILEGRPHIDTIGQFKMIAEPGEAGELSEHLARRGKAGRPATESKTEKMAEAAALRAQGVSLRETAEKLGVSKSCVSKWLFEYDRSVH